MNDNVIAAHRFPNARFVQWAALSLALHLILLAPWSFTPKFTGQRETVLSVSLAFDTRQSRPARVSPQHKPTPAVTSSAALGHPLPEHTAPASITAEHAGPSHSASSVAAMAGGVSDGSGQDSGASQARIRALLLTDLARHFDYPLVARIRGWQGIVLLGLRVEPDGRLERIRVEHSSGYAVLDHSALNSLNRLGYLSEAVAWLNGRSVDMQLPVIYRLVEN